MSHQYTDRDGLRKEVNVHSNNLIFDDDEECIRQLLESDVRLGGNDLVERLRLLQHLVAQLYTTSVGSNDLLSSKSS
jgi:hypothetical protein